MAAVNQNEGSEQEREIIFISINMNVLLVLRIGKLESEGEVKALSSLPVSCSDWPLGMLRYLDQIDSLLHVHGGRNSLKI